MAYDIYFRPKPGRFGAAPEVGATDILGEATTVANSSTTTFTVSIPFRKIRAYRGFASTRTAIVVASGHAISQFIRLTGASGGTSINLFGTLNLDTLTTKVNTAFPALSTQKDGDLVFQEGDTCTNTITTTATVNTQPVGQVVAIEFTSIY
jgi:hypothetical protein